MPMFRMIATVLAASVPFASLTQAPARTAVAPGASRSAALRIEQIGSDSTAFHVIAVLIIGRTEVIAWDAQYHLADANRLADRIVASGCRLKAIIISHPDEDHFLGATRLAQRFPGTPVYMTASAIEHFKKVSPQMLRTEKARRPADAPDSLVTPQPIPSTKLTVDGEPIELIPDLGGDVLPATNSALWIPSLRTVLAGDIAFNGVHPWLGSSDEASRARWRSSLQTLRDLHPDRVVAGHKRQIDSPDSPLVLDFMQDYLTDFDTERRAATDAVQLRDAMLRRYGGLAVPMLLGFGAQAAFRKP